MSSMVRQLCFLPRFFLVFVLLSWIGAVRPAAAQQACANAAGWDSISYSSFAANNSTSTMNCSDGFKCEKAKSGGPVIELVNPSCDPKTGPCTIRLRVPLEFPGNKQNIAIAGGSFGAPTPKVYWFLGGTPPSSCAPRFNADCGQISICGIIGAQYTGDFGDTAMTVGGVSCSNLTDPKLTTFSISVFSCESRFSCPKRLDLSGLDLTPGAVAQALGCPVPRKEECNDCMSCKLAGHGGANSGGNGGVGNPGDSGPGAMLRYAAGGAGGVGFPGSATWNTALGRYWSHDYAQRIVLDSGVNNDTRVWLITPAATFREFTNLSGGIYQTVSPSDEYRKLHRTASGWELRELDGMVHFFDSSGLWTQTVDRNGNAKVAAYSGGQLTTVTFPDGRSEAFTYHPTGKLAAITEVGVGGAASRTWSYTWTGNDLVRIERPDGTKWEFFYGDAANPGWMTRMDLVGTDGSRRVDSAWEYDAKGNTVKLWRGDTSFAGANAVEKWSFSYDNPSKPAVTTITDPLGKVATYTIGRDTVSDKPRITAVSGDCPSCGLGPNALLFYEDPANPLRPTRMTDGRGTTTAYTYNANGLMTSKTEAVGTPLERTTTWEYNGPFPALVTRREIPSTSGSGVQAIVNSYDGEGNRISRTISGIEAGNAFSHTTTSAYNEAGQATTMDPPGYGAQDQTTFTYDPSRGNLLPLTRTDPLVGATSFARDPFNRIVTRTDPNGVSMEATYDALDRPLTRTEKGATPAGDLTTTHTYDALGQLLRTTFPRGNVVEYGYDAAGRLVTMERKPDAATQGERTAYLLDAAGNRTREERQRWNGSAWVTDSSTDYVYSSRCHLDKIVASDGSVTELAYDCEGNLERMWDANHPSGNQSNPATHIYAYDLLNRPLSLTQPWGGPGGGAAVTSYLYDVHNNVTRVTDANGTVTQFVYSDRGLPTQEISEVSGTTAYVYNEHGERVSRTDARNVTVAYAVDALDRTVFVDYPDNALDTSYVYDDPAVAFSKGRLTAVSRGGQTVAYSYDRFGRRLQDGALTYEYDPNGNRSAVRYPGNVAAFYTYDFADRPESLALQDGAGPVEPLVASASYKPFGPLVSVALGNGLVETRSFDSRYMPLGIAVPGRLDWTYTTNGMGHVTAIADNLAPGGSRSFSYQDVQYYLTQADGPWGTRSWVYDRIGNRAAATRDGATESYSYAANNAAGNSPRLSQIVPGTGPATSVFHDAAGDMTFEAQGENKLRLDYAADQRLSQLRNENQGQRVALTQLTYDGRGFLSGSTFTTFAGSANIQKEAMPTYSSEGRLFHRASIDRPGPSSRRNQPLVRDDSYIFYFGDRPVALLAKRLETPPGGAPARALKFITTDPMGTPILATDAAGATLWSGGFEPFGADWNGAQAAGIFLRNAGQWQDATWTAASLDGEISYNVHRWYDARRGRYTQPDPLGLPRAEDADDSDMNLFGYAVNNPLFYGDDLGLISLPYDPGIPNRCREKFQKKIMPRLQRVANDEKCKGFFCKELNTDLPALINDVFPFIVSPKGSGGEVECMGGNTMSFRVSQSSLCQRTNEALHVIIHELGHYADCVYNGDKFPADNTLPNGHYDACQAEVACFGGSIGANCPSDKFPRKRY